MDHMIKEKFIVTDGEKVTDEIYRVTGLDIEIDQIIENISSEESNIYFFDKDLSEKPENEKDVILAWIDTGIKVNGNEPLMISLLKRSDYFSGYYVGTPSYLVNGMCRKTLYSEKKLRSNLLKFCHRYREEHAERVIESKQDYLNYGFTKEQSMMQIEPISFFDEKEEVFNPKKEDFDINQNCLIHIIQERRERFPESIRSQSDSKIAGQIMNALERGIKMQRRDRSFAKASYSGKSGTISWFMPLHIDAPLSEDPELVMVVRRSGDFYEIKTILSYDDELKDRITALSLYSKLW